MLGGKEPAQTRARLFHKYVLHTGDSVVKRDRQGLLPPRTHHLPGETDKYTTGHMIRTVKRQVLGDGEPGEMSDPAWVEGIREASRRRWYLCQNKR